ncbi:MAG TPA: ATP-binding cassette domain-containing protein [Ktedonobacteraceae bacterium]|nr:ATP-binding cassette domain-containing protein [Ktedonobacteraceae bacterium]
MGLHAEQINKWFGPVHVIQNLSMEVREGALFGFLGPNGAGKTTTMRMILDLLRPESGRITWNGTEVRKIPRRFWGYLPEERGLYPKVRVEDQLLFLARLQGLSRLAASRRLDEWLERLEMTEYRTQKVEALSKGNQQKIQFLATILHDPLILIMDEPFSGLDPVNTAVLKDALLEMHRQGKTIIFSTHQLEQVEELCEDVLIIDHGQTLLSGSVREVKRQHGRNVVRLKLENDTQALWLDMLPGVHVTKRRQDYIEMQIQATLSPNGIVETALQHGGIISRFEQAEPSLTDIFLEHVQKRASNGTFPTPGVPVATGGDEP